MDIVGKAKKLERKIARSLEAAVVEFTGASVAAPLEIVQAVLDCAEREIQEAGRGQRVFPFTRVKVQVVAPAGDKEARARFAAVADGPPSLAERLRARLASAGCRPANVVVDVVFVPRPGAQWESRDHHVEFMREAVPVAEGPAAAPVAAAPARIKLSVVTGKAAQRHYVLSGGRTDLGRGTEVLDGRQRVARTNHVAFDDESAEVNRSVSRRHAHIAYDAAREEYRLHDDRSVHGTSVVRNGKTIAVPAGSRGVRLENGDDILLGQAKIRVALLR